jgi:hypothetical protein
VAAVVAGDAKAAARGLEKQLRLNCLFCLADVSWD